MDSSFLLSLELICLMSWLVKNEKSRIKILIKDAIKDGLGKELDNIIGDHNPTKNEILHETFVNFLVYLEKELMDSLHKNDSTRPLREQLVSSLKTVNCTNLDGQTLLLSLKQAEKALRSEQATSDEQTREVLLEKIIKNWKPSKKDVIH